MKFTTPALLLLLILQPLSAQDGKLHSFIGINTDAILIRGTMNGQSYFITDTELILCPKAGPGFGAGISYGIRLDPLIIDFGYSFTVQDYITEESGAAGRSVHHVIRYLGGKGFIYSTYGKKAEIYYDFDLSVVFSRFEKIAYSFVVPGFTDYVPATYSGLNFGFGPGVMVNLTDRLKLDFRLLPELYIGTDLKAKGSDRYSIKGFVNFFVMGNGGLIYYLN
ncbi:MAG: hypothetical protein ACOYXB_14625 [Bacteroidota bacterium]